MKSVAVGQQVRVSIPRWLMNNRGLPSTEIEGRITFVTEKQVRLAPRATSKEVWLPINSITVAPLNGYSAPEPAAPTHSDSRKGALTEDTRGQPTTTKEHIRVTSVLVRGRIAVRAPFAVKDQLKAIPGATWDQDARAWTYPATPSAAANLVAAFPDLEYDTAFGDLVAQAGQQERAQEHKTATELPPIPCTKTEPWLHQLQAYWYAHDMQACMLAMEMGTGKSKIAVDLVVNRAHRHTLIVCPKSVIDNWAGTDDRPGEFQVHGGQPVWVVPLGEPCGSVANKKVMAEQAMALAAQRGTRAAVVINYESAWREPMAEWLLAQRWDLLVMDESHRLKAPGGKSSQFMSRLADRAEYRLALTGTPLAHGPEDAYAQYRALDKGVFGTSYAKYKLRYLQENHWTGKLEMQPSMEDELNQKFYSIAYRCTADVLHLPEAQHVYRTFNLSAEASRVYKELDQAFYAEVDGGTVTIANGMVKLLRLQQITSGYVKDDEHQEVKVDRAKRELLAEVLDGLPARDPLVVFVRFRPDLDAVAEMARATGRRSSELSGRRNELTDWQAGKTDLIAVQIQAGGVGIDLSRSHTGIYYSVSYSLTDFDQSASRIRRPRRDGQKPESYLYIHLLAKTHRGHDTVDQKVYAALRERKAVVESILAERGKRHG